ncbi:hypothetical protein D9758_016937 [Tetrapyrgos nigripes]|uniref:DUF6535 domain-containing protein n=2 Tax=Tetrapyrgos nigripes TaxID=182062 RepID=A0A8H5FDA7_9AGAR|nr:hypothetical protein D9758_016937 [Tetrapyrgos nigripes]
MSKSASPTDTSSPPHLAISQRTPIPPNIPSVVQSSMEDTHTLAGMRRGQPTGNSFDEAADSGNGGQGIRDVDSSHSVPTDAANVPKKLESAAGFDEEIDPAIALSGQPGTSDNSFQRSLKHTRTEVDAGGTSSVSRNSIKLQSFFVANKSNERLLWCKSDRCQSQGSGDRMTNASHQDDSQKPDHIYVDNTIGGIGHDLSTSPVHESNREYKSGTDDLYQNTPPLQNMKSPKSSGYGGTGNQPHPTCQPTALNQFMMQSEPQASSYSDNRNYDYTKKYPADKFGKEVGKKARVWKVYLDEAEEFDKEMLTGFRDTLDALLVFAALFSAVVTSFIISAVESLQPNYSQITAMLLVEQNQLLRAAGNTTAIDNVQTASVNLDSTDVSTTDLWINGLFFSSLSLSLATALLSVLVKQWLQAYSSSLPTGNAREHAKIRQFRYSGLTDWKVPQIIGTLPIILHASLGLFMAGFSLYVSELWPSLCWIVISVTAVSFLVYLGSIVIPVIVTIQCPYRIPLLFVPLNFIFFPLQIGKYLWIRYCWGQWWLEWPSLSSNSIQAAEATFLKPNGPHILHDQWNISLPHNPYTSHHSILADCIKWLQSLQSNDSMQDIVGQALHGIVQEHIIRGDNGKLRYFLPALKCYMDNLDLKLILSWILSTPRIGDEEYKSKLCTSLCTEWEKARAKFRGFPRMELKGHLIDEAFRRNLHHVKSLIAMGADVNAQGGYYGVALHPAAAGGHLEIVRYLVENRADAKAEEGYYGFALQAAATEGHLEIVRCLVEKGADVNAGGRNFGFALQTAAAKGHLEIVRYLVEKGADVNAEGGHYGFALQTAAVYRHLEIVRYLVEKGADVNAEGGRFGFALQAAAAIGHLEIVRYLVEEKGVDVNAQGGECGSALNAAYAYGHSEIAAYLETQVVTCK